MKRRIFALAVSILTLIALSGAASACFAGYYQPELPETLRK